jgi:hypothetical protein
MGLLRRPTTSKIMEDGRLGRPCGPGAHSRASQKPVCDFAAIPALSARNSHTRRLDLLFAAGETFAMTDPITRTHIAGSRRASAASGQPASWPTMVTRSPLSHYPSCYRHPRHPRRRPRADRRHLRWAGWSCSLAGGAIADDPSAAAPRRCRLCHHRHPPSPPSLIGATTMSGNRRRCELAPGPPAASGFRPTCRSPLSGAQNFELG